MTARTFLRRLAQLAAGPAAAPPAVQRTQLDLLLRKTGAFRLLSPIPFAAVLATIFYARWAEPQVLAWLGLFAVVSIAAHLRRLQSERRQPIADAEVAPTLRARERDILLFGCMWGLAPWMLDPHGELAYLLLTTTFVVATIALSSMLVTSHRQTIAAAMGTITGCAWYGGLIGWTLAACTLLFLLMVLDWIRQQTELMRQQLELRFEKEELARKLEDANREKTRFFAAASHDLRQPLHAVALFTASLERAAPGAQNAELVERLSQSVASLSRSLDTMLDVSRLDAGAVQPSLAAVRVHDLFTSLHNIYAGRAEEKGLQLRVRAPGPLAVRSDRLLLERLLGNLVDNAIKYTQGGGVLVAARAGSAAGRAGHVRFDVIDTGIGIARDHQQRVFEEFYQVGNPQRDRRLGLGIGLSVVRRLSGLLDHPVQMRSCVGKGTRFSVWVPAVEGADVRVEGPTVQVLPGRLPRHVLLVDDEEDGRRAMEMLLASHGCAVLAVANLEEAERVLQRQAVDAVVADFRLAGERSGLDFLLALRARAPQLRLLLVTGETAPEQMAQIRASGVPCLYKPVRVGELLGALAG